MTFYPLYFVVTSHMFFYTIALFVLHFRLSICLFVLFIIVPVRALPDKSCSCALDQGVLYTLLSIGLPDLTLCRLQSSKPSSTPLLCFWHDLFSRSLSYSPIFICRSCPNYTGAARGTAIIGISGQFRELLPHILLATQLKPPCWKFCRTFCSSLTPVTYLHWCCWICPQLSTRWTTTFWFNG